VATAVTRFGVVLVVIFLVQILVGLYRYNVRLATNYTSLLYLITAWDGQPPSLDMLSKVVRPPEIDFGKMPRSAFEEMATILANKIGDQFGKSEGKSRSVRKKKKEED
jgi:hypothetical protein